MKKFLLLFVGLCAAIPSFAVTYNLNGGKYNPYDWASKDDMLKAFITDGGGSTKNLLTIADYQAVVGKTDGTNAADGLHSTKVTIEGVTTEYPGLVSILSSTVVTNNFYTEKWSWLYDYVHGVQTTLTTDKATLDANKNYEKSFWAYALAAFFISGQSNRWPTSSDFSTAGKDENYFSAWGYNYGNPETVTEETTLLNPYMDGHEFQGWYDNAEFTGEKITTINASSTGTLYAKWDIVSDVTYVLNGGWWNPYGWASKDDMLAAFLADGGATCSNTISDFQAMIGTSESTDGLHSNGLCKFLTGTVASAAYAKTEKWGWLETYVNSVYEAATAAGETTSKGNNYSYSAHYGAGAFFISGKSISYPETPSFAEAGKEENFVGSASAWKYSFGCPQSPAGGFVPYTPEKTDNIFNGWYDNAEFSGEPVTSIPLGFHGTLYASWTRLSDVETPVVEQETLVNIYNISGACVLQGVDPAEVNNLAPGFYIVGNKKVLVK